MVLNDIMKTKKKVSKDGSRKLGPQKGEKAVKSRKKDNNFKQSKDIRESRNVRQSKTNKSKRK